MPPCSYWTVLCNRSCRKLYRAYHGGHRTTDGMWWKYKIAIIKSVLLISASTCKGGVPTALNIWNYVSTSFRRKWRQTDRLLLECSRRKTTELLAILHRNWRWILLNHRHWRRSPNDLVSTHWGCGLGIAFLAKWWQTCAWQSITPHTIGLDGTLFNLLRCLNMFRQNRLSLLTNKRRPWNKRISFRTQLMIMTCQRALDQCHAICHYINTPSNRAYLLFNHVK